MTSIIILLVLILWKLWQIEHWLGKLRVNSLTPGADASTNSSVHQPTSVATPQENGPKVVTAEEYRKMVGLK